LIRSVDDTTGDTLQSVRRAFSTRNATQWVTHPLGHSCATNAETKLAHSEAAILRRVAKPPTNRRENVADDGVWCRNSIASGDLNTMDRRSFVHLLGAGALAAAFPPSIKRALAIPAHHRAGTIDDVEHIVILMQENRSFDHYFGTLRGVRGFDDPRAVNLPSGAPVWRQPAGSNYVLPFHPTAPDLGLKFLEDLPHDWTDTHNAWNDGKYDQWVPSKGTTTMAYLERADIPYHFALADAFTICDAYHCSFMGATDPNRYHMWTGWVGNDGRGGGPVLDNSEAGYDWVTFPERLQQAGVSWKIYQDAGAGLDAAHSWGWGDDAYIGNYGDNSLLYFHQYQNAQPGNPLFEAARTGTNLSSGGTLFDVLRQDVRANRLPQVSWIVAPEAYTEHPNWPANFGAWYVSQCLDILTSRPDIWSKTAFFLTYDENDGFFDHVIPPTPPKSRAQGWSSVDITNEIFQGNAKHAAGPYGLGMRVPMIVISPWSRGGWVNSEVFDHTSLIRFIEARFARQHPGLVESNITKWRRAIAGDLTSAFNFRSPNEFDCHLGLPSTDGYVPPDRNRHPNYSPVPPTNQELPAQEPGIRPARAVPYELHAAGEVNPLEGTVRIHFGNTGKAAAVFHVRSGDGQGGPWTYTVGPEAGGWETWNIRTNGKNAYDLSVYGPNGFLRSFKGSISGTNDANLSVVSIYDIERLSIRLEITNRGSSLSRVRISSGYTDDAISHALHPGARMIRNWPLWESGGWYDFTIEEESDSSFERHLAGHVETGFDSISDPAIGGRRLLRRGPHRK
jgi:phospholipase C